MKRNFHVRFLEEGERATALLYSAIFTDTCALLKVHFFEFIRLGRSSKILETLNNLFITPRLFNPVRLKKLAVE